jgi:hypothetical protein
MAKTTKLIYVMILFLSLFLVAKNVDGKTFFHYFQVSFFALDLVHNLYLVLIILFYFFYLQHKLDVGMPLSVEELLYAIFLISGSAIIINVSVYKWCHSLYDYQTQESQGRMSYCTINKSIQYILCLNIPWVAFLVIVLTLDNFILFIFVLYFHRLWNYEFVLL